MSVFTIIHIVVCIKVNIQGLQASGTYTHTYICIHAYIATYIRYMRTYNMIHMYIHTYTNYSGTTVAHKLELFQLIILC